MEQHAVYVILSAFIQDIHVINDLLVEILYEFHGFLLVEVLNEIFNIFPQAVTG